LGEALRSEQSLTPTWSSTWVDTPTVTPTAQAASEIQEEHRGPLRGRVKWFSKSKGYGFIIQDNDANDEHYVHWKDVVRPADCKGNVWINLAADREVAFAIGSYNGRSMAIRVTQPNGEPLPSDKKQPHSKAETAVAQSAVHVAHEHSVHPQNNVWRVRQSSLDPLTSSSFISGPSSIEHDVEVEEVPWKSQSSGSHLSIFASGRPFRRQFWPMGAAPPPQYRDTLANQDMNAGALQALGNLASMDSVALDASRHTRLMLTAPEFCSPCWEARGIGTHTI